jgi:hypothetical protein
MRTRSPACSKVPVIIRRPCRSKHRTSARSSFAEREYLPAGNPQTSFRYGFLQAATSLLIELDAGLLGTHDVYFTAYNRASFPVRWYPLTESKHTTPAIPAAGSYLIRVHPKTSSQESGKGETVRIRVRPHRRTHGEPRIRRPPAPTRFPLAPVRGNNRREREHAAIKSRRDTGASPADSREPAQQHPAGSHFHAVAAWAGADAHARSLELTAARHGRRFPGEPAAHRPEDGPGEAAPERQRVTPGGYIQGR